MISYFMRRSITFRHVVNPFIQPMKIPKGHASDFDKENTKQQ